MVIAHHGHHVKSKSQSSDRLTPPPHLLSFPGCHWRAGPRWAGRRYRRAGAARSSRSCWADGGERRAGKTRKAANFEYEMPVIAVPLRRIMKDACSYSGMCHYETRIGGEVAGGGERQGGSGEM